ncbi:MAG: XdhC family protein [Comamonas sp.]
MTDSPALDVLQTLRAWQRAGHRAVLVTVLDTYGTSPRPPGSLAAIRDDGAVAGSVSGGCVEDVLARHVQARWAAADAGQPPPACERLRYGRDAEEQNRLRLPCGKQVHVSVEYRVDPATLARTLAALADRRTVQRTLRYRDGHVALEIALDTRPAALPAPGLARDADGHSHRLGPSHRLILVGANDVARYIAPMALALGFQVLVCEPRAAYQSGWNVPGAPLDARMPDDLIRACAADAATAVLAISHDPRLDDLALMEALPSDCFYVGVVGSRTSTAPRRARLAMLDVPPAQLNRLHSPAGLPIGSRTPPQIAVSVLAELVAAQQAAPAAAGHSGSVSHAANPDKPTPASRGCLLPD